MARSWSGKREFKKISLKLFTSEGLAFQRLTLSLLRIIWPEIVETSSGWALDRQGIDHIVWGDENQVALVVQCKGFSVPEEEIGVPQAKQCIKSIEKFIKNGKKTHQYILLHNRDGRNSQFRTLVFDAVKKLQESNKATVAEVWNRQVLIHKALDAMLDRVERALLNKELSIVCSIDEKLNIPASPVEIVPLSVSQLKADQYRLSSTRIRNIGEADPLEMLISEKKVNLTILIGEYGFGKTTTVFRALQNCNNKILYVPGAIISNNTLSTKDFLTQCVNTEPIILDLDDNDKEIADTLLRPVLEYMFKDADTPVTLIIDGLDESAPLSRKGAMQWLFNVLREVNIPVILTMRTEFWNSKYLDFSSSIGSIGKKTTTRYVYAKLIELLPWSHKEIREAISKEIEFSQQETEKSNLCEMLKLVDGDTFDDFFGDIPKRPLFLKLILDTVKEKGVPYTKIGRARLFADWARIKIFRDINVPIFLGGTGRQPIISNDESVASTVEIAWEVMLSASFAMTSVFDNSLEILADCRLSRVISETPSLKNLIEPTGLFLNSLLCLSKVRTGYEEPIIRFTHRAFQEFFLALYIVKNRSVFENVEIPLAVLNWIKEIENDKLS